LKLFRNIWLPVDFYLGISSNHRRLLEVPTVTVQSARTRAIRIEWTLLFSVCIIVDFSPVKL
jgi:hypothetical protein